MGLRRAAGSRPPRGPTPPTWRRPSSCSRSARGRHTSASRCPPRCRTCSGSVALVEGLPLGIELAAAWVRTIPCGEIAAAIEREAATLASPHRNRAERHRTLDAVVAYSWNLLRPDEQRALAALSAFAGGFARDAAERIADAPTRTLSALVDKSLVRRRADGRYDLHELVRQFAWARLAKMRSRQAEIVRRHAEFFASLLLDVHGSSRGPDEPTARRQLSIELPNIMAAWTRSLDAGVRDVVERMAATLVFVLHIQARLPAAMAVGERAVAMLGPRARADVLGAVRLQWGRAAVTGGVPDVGKRELESALQLVRDVGTPDAIARCLYYMGSLAFQQADFDTVDALMSEALPLADRSEDQEVVALVHNQIGSLANLRSRFDIAELHLRQGLAAARRRGIPSLVGGMLSSLAVPLYYRGNFAEAADLSAEAARIYEDLGRNATVINIRGNVAAIKLAQGDLAGAHEQAVMAVDLARDAGDQNELCNTLATMADVRLQQEAFADARAAVDGKPAHRQRDQQASADYGSAVRARHARPSRSARRARASAAASLARDAGRACAHRARSDAGPGCRRLRRDRRRRVAVAACAKTGSARCASCRHRRFAARQGAADARARGRKGARRGDRAVGDDSRGDRRGCRRIPRRTLARSLWAGLQPDDKAQG